MPDENQGSGNSDSPLSGFYKLAPSERREKIAQAAGLTPEEKAVLEKAGNLDIETANRMIENVIGTHSLPIGIATNFLINSKEVIIPMVIEEPSVVAAASNAAKLARPGGGFRTSSDEPIMAGLIQVVGCKHARKAMEKALERSTEILDLARQQDPVLVKFGGGPLGLEGKVIKTPAGNMVIFYLYVNVGDAMGANAVNTMAEAVSPLIEEITGGKARLRIISNLADRRLARAEAVWKKEAIGEEAVKGIMEAYYFAEADPYRCATHNKGVMNGIDALVVATGNDFRAIEAGAHSYAARNRRYESLTKYSVNENGDLVGKIELPMAIGLVGGATKTHPTAKIAVKILGVKKARELAEIAAALGLAQNFAALRALATEGIQRGHMKLHASNMAVLAGAAGDEIEKVAMRMIEEKAIRADRAKEILDEMRSKS